MAAKGKLLKYALLALISLTLLFIFVQSALPPETSGAQSDAVGEIVGEIIPPETKPGAFIQINLRKIAHFIEFFCLGTEVALYVALFLKRPIFIALSYPASLLSAFLDESIQMLSGRGPSIFDVWIDFFGFLIAASLTYAIFFSAKHFIMRKNTGETLE